MAYVYPPNGKLERLNSFINESATIVENAGAALSEPAHKAVMYDTNGDVVIAASGDKAIGLILSSSLDPIEQGRQVHILIKYIGLGEAGTALNKGDLLTVNASGQLIPATSGAFIFGRAFTSVANAGEDVQVQINQMGYMA
jgi:hypothetical protein